MFYTKYRPQKFSEISRPNSAADALSTQVKSGKTCHAYLFIGSRGTGKTSTARILAKSLNCNSKLENGDPCDTCQNCIAVKNQSLTDLVEIDAASNRGIEDIRELQSKVNLSPIQGKHKVYIIDEVHMLTAPAFNALLKTLEEPPKSVTFILCTTESNKVPDTIKSRCQVFTFKRATNEQLKQKLLHIAKNENYKLHEETLNNIVKSSLGGFRDAETLLQQVIEGEIKDLDFNVTNDYSNILQFISFIQNNQTDLAIKTVDNIYLNGSNLTTWLGEVISVLRTIILIKSGAQVLNIDISDDILQKINNDYINTNIVWYIKFTNLLLKTINKIDSSFIPQLPIEIAIITMCSMSNNTQSRGVVPNDPLNNVKKNINSKLNTSKNLNSNQILSTEIKTNSNELSTKKQEIEENLENIENKNNSPKNIVSDPSDKIYSNQDDVKKPLEKNYSNQNDVKHADEEGSKIITQNINLNHEDKVNSNTSSIDHSTNNSIIDINTSLNTIINSNDYKNTDLKDSNNLTELKIEIDHIVNKWEIITQKASEHNTALISILKSAVPVSIQGNKIVLDVFFDFHKDRLETMKNKEIMDKVLSEVLETGSVSFICNVNPQKPKKLKDREVGVLTDVNVVPVETKDLMQMFDGGLPL